MSYLNLLLIPTIITGLSYASYRLSMWSVLKRLQETKSKLLEAGIDKESDIIVEINNHIGKIKCFKIDKKMFYNIYGKTD
tara:strand:- start:214 stop:453 length:240 start_codon:yes stop_codon:yes gene_type:complete